MSNRIDKLIAGIAQHCEAYETAAIMGAVHELQVALRATGERPGEPLLGLLPKLRNARAFPALETFANGLLEIGIEDETIRRFLAQSMIETGRVIPAIDVLNGILARIGTDRSHPEFAEAHGLLGRCHKQRFVDSAKLVPDPTRHQYIATALDHYRQMVEPGALGRTPWHSINVIGLLARMQQDGLAADRNEAEALSRGLIADLLPQATAGTIFPWAYATLGEASLALGQPDLARTYLDMFASCRGVDAHMLASTIRQLEQVWGLRSGADQEGAMIALLKQRLAELTRGQAQFSRLEIAGIEQLARLPEPTLEARIGREGPRKLRWLRKGFEAARSIARVFIKGTSEGKGHGTGFLIRGSVLCQKLGDELLLLTNEHVISRVADQSAIAPEWAELRFDEMPELNRIELGEIVAFEPRTDLDFCLVRLKSVPDGLQPITIASLDWLPANLSDLITPRRKAYVIGSPGGGDLSISLDDAEITDLGYRRKDEPEQIFMHYRTPTEPGSSGSPVFNDDWLVIGLHHAGLNRSHEGNPAPHRALSGRNGFNWANEGIALGAIARSITRQLTG